MSQRTRSRTTGAATAPKQTPPTEAALPSVSSTSPATPPDAPAVAAPRAKRAARAQRADAPIDAPAPHGAAPAQESERPASFAPETLARTLRAVADELERDPALARRVAAAANAEPPAPEPPIVATIGARRFKPRLITGASPDLGPGVPDPFALLAQRGEAGLRAALEELRLGSLRAIIREHQLETAERVARLNDAEKLRALIMDAALARASERPQR